MRDARIARGWIWAALALQAVGLAFDGVWCGVIRPGVEPTTFAEMIVHLGTVHLSFYLGVLSVGITSGWVFVERRSGSAVFLAGGWLSTSEGAWRWLFVLRVRRWGGWVVE